MITGKIRAVIDTNIDISSVISKQGNPARIIERLSKGDFENYLTQEIISEIKGILERADVKSITSYEYIIFIFSNFLRCSRLIAPMFDERVILNDKSDDKFINCALSANADVVSGDKHLLGLKKHKGVRIFSPREFLERLK